MKRSTERSVILLLILVSLLLHIGSLLFTIFKTSSAQKIAQQKMNLELPAFKDNRQAAMQARKSNFGAPVVFKNPTPPQKQQKQTQESPASTPKEKPEIVEPPKLIKKEKLEKTSLIVQKELSKKFELSKPAEKPLEKKIKKIEDPQKTIIKPKPKIIKKPQKQTPPPQKKVTLANLANGFLSHIKDKGQYDITMEGDKNKVPDQEQLNIAQYGKKLLWQVQNSYKINKHMLYNLPHNIQADFIVGVSIPRNGIGSTCQLIQSTGSAQVDSCLLFIYEQATTALPPVPSCITQQPLRISVRDRTDTTLFAKSRSNIAFGSNRRRFGS